MKFKSGDKIVVNEYGRGFESATVTGVIKQNGKQYYTLKILCGTATIPISAEVNYKLLEE
jgi:RNA polymerase-interacting CarD/CdnL/TRCF family regulator